MGVKKSKEEIAELRRQTILAIKEAKGMTQSDIAETLRERTGDYVSVKAVQSWLCNPKARHHRPCPGWVVFVLKAFIPEDQ